MSQQTNRYASTIGAVLSTVRAAIAMVAVAVLTAAIIVVVVGACSAQTDTAARAARSGPSTAGAGGSGGLQPRILWSAAVPPQADRVLAGDFFAGPEAELAVVAPTEVVFFQRRGVPERSVPLPQPNAAGGFVADVDGDGKADLVLGSAGDSTNRVRVLNGLGEMIAEITGEGLTDGYTHPAFVLDNRIFFVSGNRFLSTPRSIGVADMVSRRITILRQDGVLPVGLAYNEPTGLIGVHSRGLSRVRRGSDFPMQTPADRSAAMVIDPNGLMQTFQTFGDAVIEGSGGVNQAGIVSTYPLLSASGAPVTLAAIAHPSSLYGGVSRVVVIDAAGTVVAEHRGFPATDVDVEFFTTDGAPRLAVVWSSVGVIDILTPDLVIERRIELDLGPGNLRLGFVADVTGDDVPDIVSRHTNRLVVSCTRDSFDRLTVPFAAAIHSTTWLKDADRPVVAVLADRLHALSLAPEPASAAPASAPAAPDAAALRSAITARFADELAATQATDAVAPLVVTTVPAGSPAGSDLEGGLESAMGGPTRLAVGSQVWDGSGPAFLTAARLPPGYQFLGMFDVVGNGDPELVVLDGNRGQMLLLDTSLAVVSVVILPERVHRISFFDVTGDGKTEILLATQFGPTDIPAVWALTGTGGRLFRTPLSYVYDSVVTPTAAAKERLFVHVVTGHMMAPRGVYALDAATGSVQFFYEMAGFPQSVLVADDTMFVSVYTPNNGHSVQRSDAQTDTDGRLFLHITTLDGQTHPSAGPLTSDAHRGMLYYSAPGNQLPVHVAEFRDATYNPGPSGVYRFADDGSLRLVVRGADHEKPWVHVVTVGDKEYLQVYWGVAAHIDYYDTDYQLVESVSVAGLRPVGTFDVVDSDTALLLVAGGGEVAVTPVMLGTDPDPAHQIRIRYENEAVVHASVYRVAGEQAADGTDYWLILGADRSVSLLRR